MLCYVNNSDAEKMSGLDDNVICS